jgi:sugar/nucleoside kinase (ribokinase family)
MNEPEVLVVGRYFADLVFHGMPRPATEGSEVFADGLDIVPGGAFTSAMALHRLGRRVRWSADFGDDHFSADVLASARAEGLDDTAFRHHDGPLRSVTVALSGPGDRAMVSYQDPVEEAVLEAILLKHRPKVLLLPLLRFDDDTLAGLKLAATVGTTVFMDCQDVAATIDDPRLLDALALTDVFTPNADEALRLTGAADLDGALAMLAPLVDTVVIKRGSAGAVAVHRGTRCDVPAIAVEVVDTTAAGDCFAAGFLHARLSGHPLPDCVAAGVACGSCACTGPGSREAPDLAGMDRWLARVPPGRVSAYPR